MKSGTRLQREIQLERDAVRAPGFRAREQCLIQCVAWAANRRNIVFGSALRKNRAASTKPPSASSRRVRGRCAARCGCVQRRGASRRRRARPASAAEIAPIPPRTKPHAPCVAESRAGIVVCEHVRRFPDRADRRYVPIVPSVARSPARTGVSTKRSTSADRRRPSSPRVFASSRVTTVWVIASNDPKTSAPRRVASRSNAAAAGDVARPKNGRSLRRSHASSEPSNSERPSSERGERSRILAVGVIAVARQIEVAERLRIEQAADVRGDRDAVAGPDLLGHRGARRSRSRRSRRATVRNPARAQIRGRDQAVVAAADDGDVVAVSRGQPGVAASGRTARRRRRGRAAGAIVDVFAADRRESSAQSCGRAS